jgi:hypothetical protein
MGLRQWLSWDELEHLFRREPQMDRVRVGRWLTSAERRGQIVRSDDLPPRHRRVDVLPFDSSAPHPAPPPA